MKVDHPFFATRVGGQLGKQLIFRRTRRGHTAYRYFKPVQPGSTAQLEHSSLFSLLAHRWPSLSAEAKNQFSGASEYIRVSKYNAYLMYNLRRLNRAQLDGLVAWWPNIVPGGTTLHDLCPDHYDGELENLNPDTAWPTDQFRDGQTIEISGDGYVDVPDPPSVTSPFTMACWFKQNDYVHRSAILDTGSVTRYTFGYFWSATLMHVLRNVTVPGPGDWTTIFAWHHLAFQWDGSQINLWLDGVPVAGVGQNLAPAAQTTMWIGRRGVEAPDFSFHGRIDDLRLYDRILTTPNVEELAAR